MGTKPGLPSRSVALSLILGLSLGACTPWPRHGKGGLAQIDHTPYLITHQKQACSALGILKQRLLIARHYITVLESRGARHMFPARLKTVKTQADRVDKEITGELYSSAWTDLIILEKAVNRLNRRVNDVRHADIVTNGLGKPVHRSVECKRQ